MSWARVFLDSIPIDSTWISICKRETKTNTEKYKEVLKALSLNCLSTKYKTQILILILILMVVKYFISLIPLQVVRWIYLTVQSKWNWNLTLWLSMGQFPGNLWLLCQSFFCIISMHVIDNHIYCIRHSIIDREIGWPQAVFIIKNYVMNMLHGSVLINWQAEHLILSSLIITTSIEIHAKWHEIGHLISESVLHPVLSRHLLTIEDVANGRSKGKFVNEIIYLLISAHRLFPHCGWVYFR